MSRLLFVPLVLSVIAILTIMPQAFADTAITISKGDSADQSCVTAKNCYNPDVVTVTPGTTVTWTNADSVSHTVTSGNPSDNQTGTVFDSSLVRPAATYSFTFKDPGTYNYFCQLHPWMTGQVIVAAATSSTSNNTPTTSMPSSSSQPSTTSGNSMSSMPSSSSQPSTTSGNSMSSMPSSSGTNIVITSGSATFTSCEQTSTCFGPDVLYVAPGSTVTWKNNDIVSHNITYGSPESSNSVTPIFNSNTLAPGQTFTYQFSHPGFYSYYDKSYQWETGLVIVKASS
ncbi:MAG: cupredoxin domain-containing protein [Nitrosotalea sp.]